MVRYFILIKRKNSKRFLGVIPTRKGISLSDLKEVAKKQIRRGLKFRIISEGRLKKFLPKVLRRPKGLNLGKRLSKSRKSKRKSTRKKSSRKGSTKRRGKRKGR